jgi:plastocyanin
MAMSDRRYVNRVLLILTAVSVAVWMPGIVCASSSQVPLPTVRSAPATLRPSPAPTPTPIPPGNLRVEVVLVSGGNRLPGDDSVVWMDDMRATGATSEQVKIAQRKKQFEPRVSIASVGSTVDFPNFDRVFHNVFSLSTPKSFDLGLYRKGKSKSVRFDHPGLVQVYCNIHPHMAAYLMIVDSARHGSADSDGRITLRAIPAGRQTVRGWNARGGMWTRQVTVRPARTSAITVELDISSWRETPHVNKHGKEYPPPDDDDFRY